MREESPLSFLPFSSLRLQEQSNNFRCQLHIISCYQSCLFLHIYSDGKTRSWGVLIPFFLVDKDIPFVEELGWNQWCKGDQVSNVRYDKNRFKTPTFNLTAKVHLYRELPVSTGFGVCGERAVNLIWSIQM